MNCKTLIARTFRASGSVLALIAGSAAAHAKAAESSEYALADGIIVIGKAEGYVATESVTATKTDTPLIDVPQTIQVVTREKLEDQASHSMAEVLHYIPGITVGQGEGNRDQITLRGQNTTADFFLDGVRDDVQYFRSLYNIERVEVLKGPYAMIFGRGGGGGIINRVQKTPQDTAHVAGSASVNTFGGYDVTADINQPLATAAALRLNAFYEKLESNRDFVDGERFAVNPYLAADLGAGWKVGLSYEYVNDDRVPDRGVPSVECATAGCIREPLKGHRDTFFGVPGINRAELEAHIAKLRVDGELAENLNWSTTVLYGDYDKYYTNVFPNSMVRLSDNTFQLDGYRDDTERKNFIVQSNLVWDAELGGLDQKVLFGVEYGDQDTTNGRKVSATKPRINPDNFTYPVFAFPFTSVSRATTSHVKFFSAYVQDQISIGEHIDLIGGLRYDKFEIDGRDIVAAQTFGRTDEKWSPRFGVVLKPQPNISIYGSYSQSFLPRSGDQFISLTPTSQTLAPEKFTNYELGAKWDIRPGLNLSAALFQLDRTNTTTPDPLVPTTTIFAGTTRTRGAEVMLVGRITPQWQMSGGYTYQDSHLKGKDVIRVAQVPKHHFALWNRYDFTPFLGAGVGVIHQSSQWAALHNPVINPSTGQPISPATRLPAFTRVDAAVFFKASETLQFQINVENLLDEEYFSDAHNNNNISPGAPINARFTARVKF